MQKALKSSKERGRAPRERIVGFPYLCRFTLDPFEIRIATLTASNAGLSLNQLSESERFRFSVAFQLALAMVTNFRFVVIDRAGVLDREKRRMLTGLLVNSRLDQAIVLVTSDEAAPSILPNGVQFLNLVEGTRPCEGFSTAA